MTVKIIAYDLCAPGRDYSDLYKLLNTYTNCIKITESLCLTNSIKTCSEIRNELKNVTDKNDRLFVAKLTGEAAWSNLLSIDTSVKMLFQN